MGVKGVILSLGQTSWCPGARTLHQCLPPHPHQVLALIPRTSGSGPKAEPLARLPSPSLQAVVYPVFTCFLVLLSWRSVQVYLVWGSLVFAF